MIDVFKVADILVENVKRNCAHDIAIVAYYGSYAHGVAHEKSDLDFFYIPDSPRKIDASCQFILEGIGFDFWPIRWARAERIAEFNESLVSVIADARVLYARSDADLARFNALKNRIAELRKPKNRHIMFNKALTRFQQAFQHLYALQQPNHTLSTARLAAYPLVTTVLHSLALLNQTYFTRGWGQNMDQVRALKIKPRRLNPLLKQITTQRSVAELQNACENLIRNAQDLFTSEEKKRLQPRPFADVFTGFHEEATGLLNKITAACDRQDYDTAFLAAVHLQDELNASLAHVEGVPDFDIFACHEAYLRAGFPDLAAIVENGNLDALKRAVAELDKKMKALLKAHKIRLNTFNSLDAFQSFIQKKNRKTSP